MSAALGCGTEAPPRFVKVGAVIDRTGSIAAPTWRDDIQLATDQANVALNQKAFANLQFHYLLNDSENDPDVASTRALQTRDQGAVLVVTDTSRDVISVNRKLNYDPATSTTPLPVVCFACNAPSINNPDATDIDPIAQAALRDSSQFVYRVMMSSSLIGRVLLNMVLADGASGDVNGDGRVKISFYSGDEPFGTGTVSAVNAAIEVSGRTVLTETILHPASVDENAYNWGADLALTDNGYNETTRTFDGDTDAVIEVTSFPVAVTRTFLTANYPRKLFHTQTFRVPSTIQNLGLQAEGQSGVAYLDLNGVSGTLFADAFKLMTQTDPIYRDSMAYDAMAVSYLAVIHAVHTHGLDDPTWVTPEQVRSSLQQLNDPAGTVIRPGEFGKAIDELRAGRTINYEGASGGVDFDAEGNVRNVLVEWTVQSGRFVDVSHFDCATSDACVKTGG
jgi:hypothetical protein